MKFTADQNNVKLIGRTMLIGDTLWLGLSGTGAEFVFTGKKLSVTFVADEIAHGDQNEIARAAVFVDGVRKADEMLDTDEKTVCVIDSEEPVTANVQVIKLTESPMSAAGVKPLETDDGASIVPAAERPLKMEFIGDSITCGYGVDDEVAEHQFKTATEDVTRAYAYKTARMLNADYSMFSASGYGIITGYIEGDVKLEDQRLPQFYESLGYSRGSFGGVKPQDVAWDFSRFVPDIIVINLGTNDDSYCRDFADRRADYQAEYVKFLKEVRRLNPDSVIFCGVGIMGTRIYLPLARPAAAYCAETGDRKVFTVKFFEQDTEKDGVAANWHPTEATHEKAAKYLTMIIKETLGWD